MTQQPRYFEIARGNLTDLLDEINMEVRVRPSRLISIVVLTDTEYEERKDDAAWERDRLKELEAKAELVLDEAEGRLLSREEWDELEVLPGNIDWEKFDPSNLGPYVAVLERVTQESKTDDLWPIPSIDINLNERESKPLPDPNIDDEIPF